MFDAWQGCRQFSRLSDAQRNIVFYAENRNDWHHFSAIIERLTEQYARQVIYLTSDRSDICFTRQSERLRCYYIGEGVLRIWTFRVMRADLLVLTMMDLDNLHVKRSLHPVHYLYVFHSPGSTHMVDHANSYDHYDSVLCVGPHHVAEIRRREELAGLPAKRLIAHGYQRIEHLVAEAARRPARSIAEPPVVLVAPTWGDNSMLNVCGEALLDVLVGTGFRVVLRPHHQTVKLSPVLIHRFKSKYADSPLFEYVDLMGESDSLFDSDLLICDWSGMAIEYTLALQKPVVFIDVPPRVRNPDWEQWQIRPMELAIREQVGVVVSPQHLDTLPETIRALLTNRDRMQPKMDTARENYLFNFGRSVEVAAEAIVTLADQLAGEREARR